MSMSFFRDLKEVFRIGGSFKITKGLVNHRFRTGNISLTCDCIIMKDHLSGYNVVCDIPYVVTD